eukprot:GFUD01003848.1.p1 GENE.GFUD01003848.1~~GFUD01003848.1.p1  ORF type:complete len:407 (+),score=150.31 GFUD01003848.1:162-1382(+)
MGKKGRPEFGTPKWISNNMKSKGLQKLRWYCQMCQKQCRDENGFKCHTTSESHQRQLLLFGDNPGKYLHSYSRDFEKAFNDILRRQYNEKRVHANVVYQQYISDKQHVHMNATCWVTLTSYVRHLGRTEKAIIDENEKGWYITWIVKDPEQEAKEKKAAKKEKMVKDDEERIKEYIDLQIERAKIQAKNDKEFMATELLKSEEEILMLDLKVKDVRKVKADAESDYKNALKEMSKVSDNKPRKKDDNKRRIVALEEIMEDELKKKRLKEKNDPEMVNAWIRPNIVVKIVTKSLGDKYYKKKGRIEEVIDDFAAVVVLNESGDKLKLDQEHLETVIPSVGREVVVLWGKFGGREAVLDMVNTKKFSAELLLESGEKVSLPYEQFSKKFCDDVVFVPRRKVVDVINID